MTVRQRTVRLLRVVQVLALLLAAGLLPTANAGAQEEPTTSLGSYSMTGRAAPIYEAYHQPAAPIPANPTQELSLGHAEVSVDNGTSHSVASALWPGATAANLGAALHDVDPRIPLLPKYPILAETYFPASEGQESSANLDGGVYAMRAESTALSALAVSRSTEVEGVLGTGTATSRVTGTAEGETAVTVARSSVSDIDIAGVIKIEQVSTVAEATSDGTTAKLSGRTLVSGLTIQGNEFTVDSDGIHAPMENNVPIPIRDVTGPLNEQLLQLGIQMFVAEPIDLIEGAAASRSLGGLIITFKPKTLASNIPPEIISQIPPDVPGFLTTFDQTITIALGGVAVRAAASPPVPPPPPPPPPGGDGGTLPPAPGPIVSPAPPGDGVTPVPTGTTEPPAGATLPVWMGVGGGLFAGISSRVLRRVADKALLGEATADACPLGGN